MNKIAARRERLRYAWSRARAEGVAWTACEVARRAAFLPAWLVLLPFTLLLCLAGYRRVAVITERIGHLAAEIDCLLKLQALGRLPARRFFVLAPPRRTANACLVDYWRERLTIIHQPVLCSILDIMSRIPPLRYDISDYVLTVTGAATYYRVNAEWGSRPPLLRIRRAHAERGRAALLELGIPEGAWFVCVHVREGGYSPSDEKVHAFRNANIAAVFPAMEAIVARGGWCVRMGDPSMARLPPLERVVDYAHHSLRSAEMDVFLCASCRFFLGNTSGLFIVSSAFGVPSALVNIAPFATMGFSPDDLSIPKLLRSKSEGRYLGFEEILSSPVSNYRMARLYEEAGIELVDNTAEEIEELAVEMIDRMEGRAADYAAFDLLQARF
jgi:putative glycosyltransferase (TIGR04372 family)